MKLEYAIHHKTTWQDWQITLLEKTIAYEMAHNGSVDMYNIAQKVGRTVAACIKKAEDMGISYRQRKRTREEYAPIRFIKGDMVGLPKHRSGDQVRYE